ncbi:MAG: Na+-dependent transporter [Bradyrhizobiaceae bacterium]|nr:Na+-dependent transporter [Bradyrhizobiaceae bacterium]
MSSVPGTIVAALAWLGQQGTRAVAAVVFLGLALPGVDAVLKPHVSEAIFALLCIAFLRVEPDVLGRQLKRPGVVVAATLWSMLVIPSLFGAACLLTGIDRSSPDLHLGLMLQAMASPMMSAPVFAALMGLDTTLVLVTMVASTALTTATAPLFAWLFVGPALQLSPAALGVRLSLILAGALTVAVSLRRLVGPAAIRRWKEPIDGFNVIILYVFVGAVMENVGARVMTDTWRMAGLAALAFATVLVVLALTTAAFARTGASRAFALGLMASQRNMGLMLAATSRDLPDLVWLYFAFCQFPIYLLPQLLKPLARRFARADAKMKAAPGAS